MALPTIYSSAECDTLLRRVNNLSQDSKPLWGKMNVSQMLAHLNVMFDIAMNDNQKRPNGFVRFMLKTLVKDKLVNEVPYKKNSRTAPEMIIHHQPNFGEEKEKVSNYLKEIPLKGVSFFNGREHPTFGALTTQEWNNLFYKHIDHHLNQFNV